MSGPKSWLANANPAITDIGKRLRERAEETLTQLVDVNPLEHARPGGAENHAQSQNQSSSASLPSVPSTSGAFTTRHASRDQRVMELEDLCASMSTEIAALKDALRRTSERASGDAETEALRKECQKLRDQKIWAEEECKEFERECEEQRKGRERAEAEKKTLERELEAKQRLAGSTTETSSDAKADDSKALVDAAEKERDRALQQVKSMRGVNETLQGQLKEYAKRVPDLERERDDARAEKAEMAESLALARSETANAERGRADASDKAESLKKERDALEAQLNLLKKREENSKQVQSDVEAAKERTSDGALKRRLVETDAKLAAANEQLKTLKEGSTKQVSDIGSLTEAKDTAEAEARRLREEVKLLIGAVAERNAAMTELAELRTELADARRSLEANALAGSSNADVEAERNRAEQELLTMARRVGSLEQQLRETQRAQEEAAAEMEREVDKSARGDKEEIERLKARCDELEAARAEAERGLGKLTADSKESREALAKAKAIAAEAEDALAELASKAEAAEIRVANANSLADASKKALEEFKSKASEIARTVQDTLRSERDAAKIAAESAELDRDAWREKCNEARETLERWREKARKLMAAKDAEIEAVRAGTSPSRGARSTLFDDEDTNAEEVAADAEQSSAAHPPARRGDIDDVHAEYLAEVVKRFFLLPFDDNDRADALVPVICRILRLSMEDEFRIKAHRASQRAKSAKFLGGYFA